MTRQQKILPTPISLPLSAAPATYHILKESLKQNNAADVISFLLTAIFFSFSEVSILTLANTAGRQHLMESASERDYPPQALPPHV